MVWHIIKKDWKLSWLMITGVAAIHWAVAVIDFKLGVFSADHTLSALRAMLGQIAFMGSALLIAVIVQQDAIPGVRQDWLVRPIQRWQLLLEKVLFVVAAVQGPILAADIFQGLANGFPLRQTLPAALSRSVFLLLALTLPVLAFTSLTRNMMEAIVSAVIALFAVILVEGLTFILIGGVENLRLVAPTLGSDVGWIGESLRFVLILLGVSAILGLQYFRRKTMLSRCLTAVFFLLVVSIFFLPWKPAFAIQRRLSPNPGSGAATVLAFNPVAGRFHPSDDNMRRSNNEGRVAVHVPLQVAGLPTDSVLVADRSDVCLIGVGGKTEYCGTGEALKVRKEGPDAGEVPTYQEIDVPIAVYRLIKDQPTRLEINYSLTQWRLYNSYAIPAVGGDERMLALGWCKTIVNESETGVELHCMQPGRGPASGAACATSFLENATTGRRNPENFACEPDYSPYFEGSNSTPSVTTRFYAYFEFRDWAGLAHFPVDGPQLSQSRIVTRLYRPEDHFTRHLVIPQITLKEWEAQ